MSAACALCGHPHPEAPHLHVGSLGTGYIVDRESIAKARASAVSPPVAALVVSTLPTIADIAPIAIAESSATAVAAEPGQRTHGVAKAHGLGGKRKKKAASGQTGLF